MRYLTIFFAILDASLSSPRILIIDFNSFSSKLLITLKAEISFKPWIISNFFRSNENPLSSCLIG